MNDDLVLRFIGLDMLTTVASQIGNSVDRLARRIETLGATSQRGYGQSGEAAILAKQRITQAAADIQIAEGRAEAATASALLTVTQARGSAATMAARRGLVEAEAAEQVVVAEQKVARGVLDSEKAQQLAIRETEAVNASKISSMVGGMTRVGSVMALVGVGFLAAGAIVAGGLGVAVKHAADFQAQMALIETQAGAPRGEIQKMSGSVLSLGNEFGYAGVEASRALYHVESLGFRGNQAATILRAGMEGARIGMADLEQTVNVLGTVMASHITGVKDARDAMAQLDAIVGIGNMRMDELNAAFRSGIIGSAQMFGVTLKDVGAALATLTDLGMPAAQAGTRLRMSFSLLAAPAGQATKILEAMGLTSEEAAADVGTMWTELEKANVHITEVGETLRSKGLIPALQLMRDEMTKGGLNANEQAAAISRAFGGGRSGAAIMSLLENMDRLKLRYNDITRLQASFGERVKIAMDLAATKFAKLHSAIANLAIILGGVLMPVFMPIIEALTGVFDGVSKWIEQNEGLVRSLAPIIAIVLVGIGLFLTLAGAFLIVGALFAAFTAFGPALLIGMGPAIAMFFTFVRVVAIIVGVIALLHSNWSSFQGFWDSRVVPAWNALVKQMAPVWAAMQEAARFLIPSLKYEFKELSDRLAEKGGMWDEVTQGITDFLNGVKAFLQSKEFAEMLAAFEVLLPGVIQMTIASFETLAWAAKLALDTMATSAKVSWDLFNGNFAQAVKDADKGGKDIANDIDQMSKAVDRGMKAADEAQKAWQAGFDDAVLKYERKLQDVPKMTEDAMDKLPGIVQKHTLAAAAEVSKSSTRIGTNIADGIIAGIQGRFPELDKAGAEMVRRAEGSAIKAGLIESPSKLFEKNVGRPIAQGIAIGIDQATEPVVAVQHLVTKMADASGQVRSGASPAFAIAPTRDNSDDQPTNFNFRFEIPVCINEKEIGYIIDQRAIQVVRQAVKIQP